MQATGETKHTAPSSSACRFPQDTPPPLRRAVVAENTDVSTVTLPPVAWMAPPLLAAPVTEKDDLDTESPPSENTAPPCPARRKQKTQVVVFSRRGRLMRGRMNSNPTAMQRKAEARGSKTSHLSGSAGRISERAVVHDGARAARGQDPSPVRRSGILKHGRSR